MPVLFSRACEYALRGLVEMAKHPDTEYWTVQELAERSNTPAPFLAKTFQILVKQRILTSTKGRRGGFALRRSPDKISILEIVNIIDGPSLMKDCVLGFAECGDEEPCPFHDQWATMRTQLVEALSTQTLQEFAQR